ncbi:hypothetical protein ALC57_16849 [Trachymyrmex cornetzi]|uniref:Uncharacterized protein n=1 Tax=Trachymyrmex cornetzi TaxID=471704 RepID=A0A151IUB1_9HYME|nr:hypothetical protein ALC57_16849 [Trachymyrmex cornetzi]
MSQVEIAIGDTRGNRIVLPHTTWMAFIEKRSDIQQLLRSSTPSPLMIQDLVVIELVKIRDVENVKLSLERVERELLEQCDQITTLAECFAWQQRCEQHGAARRTLSCQATAPRRWT